MKPGPDEREILVLTGMHRSGTTFTGRILEAAPGLTYLHEPFNPNHGLRGIDVLYPYVDDPEHPFTRRLDALFEGAIALRGRYRFWVKGDSLRKRAVRLLLHGRGDLEQWRARFRSRFRPSRITRRLVKDPFAMLALGHLVDRHGVRAVVLVRHPVAVWRSIRRMGWSVGFHRVGGPMFEARLRRDGEPTREELNARPRVEKVGLLWRFLYRDLASLAASRDGRVLVVRHEDLCREPALVVERIAAHFRLSVTEALRRKVEAFTGGRIVTPAPGKLHEFRRDSRAMAWAWAREAAGPEEEALRRITEPTVLEHYGFWRPPGSER